MNKDIQFYSFCFPGKPAKIRMHNQIDLMLGVAQHNQYNENYSHDDTGDNISYKNHLFGQTTGLYWVWKNSNSEYVGVCTYRIFWDQEALDEIDLDENTLIVPPPFDVRISLYNPNNYDYSVMTHYTECHGKHLIPLLYGLCKIEDIPITIDMIDSLHDETYLYPFSMFIASNEVKNKILSILFEVLLKFDENYSYLFNTIEKNIGQKRMIDYLAERLIHIIYKNIDHFIPGLKIRECKIINLPH